MSGAADLVARDRHFALGRENLVDGAEAGVGAAVERRRQVACVLDQAQRIAELSRRAAW